MNLKWAGFTCAHMMHVPMTYKTTVLVHNAFITHTVAAQMVTLESPSPHPTCPNQSLVYNCQLGFLATFMEWKHAQFGSLGFLAGARNEGDMVTSSDSRVVANLTMNREVEPGQFMMASTLTFFPPLNDLDGSTLNNTVLTCEGGGIGVSDEDSTITTTILLTGKLYVPHNRCLVELHSTNILY